MKYFFFLFFLFFPFTAYAGSCFLSHAPYNDIVNSADYIYFGSDVGGGKEQDENGIWRPYNLYKVDEVFKGDIKANQIIKTRCIDRDGCRFTERAYDHKRLILSSIHKEGYVYSNLCHKGVAQNARHKEFMSYLNNLKIAEKLYFTDQVLYVLDERNRYKVIFSFLGAIAFSLLSFCLIRWAINKHL